MKRRLPQYSFALTPKMKAQLEDLARVLGVSKAEVLKTAIAQLWDSIPEPKRRALTNAREVLARDARGPRAGRRDVPQARHRDEGALMGDHTIRKGRRRR